jgi:type IV secretion system protein VirB9
MSSKCGPLLAVAWLAIATQAAAESADPRIREVQYEPTAIVTLPVKRGVVTLIALDPDEAISDLAAGLGSDCSKAEAAWCVAAQSGGRDIFVKPKSTAKATNNLAVVTDKRRHSFRLVVLDDGDSAEPVYRLTVRAPAPETRAVAKLDPPPLLTLPFVPEIDPRAAVGERLTSSPVVVNTDYSIAEGKSSEDIVPSLIFDDGRFTYLRFAGNREVPAVFHVLPGGSETLVNARMEGDLLVVDRVSRRLALRAGAAVVGVWNEAFDLDGQPPRHGTTVPGVERTVRAGATP